MTDPGSPTGHGHPILYVVSTYPKSSHTFIAREIRALEARGYDIRVASLNRTDEAPDLALDPRAEARTTYLKHDRRATALALGRQWRRRPRGMWHALRTTRRLRPGAGGRRGADLRALVAAAAVVDLADRHGIGHVHAHFGLTPASIALLAGEISARDRDPLVYSLTIHGWHEFVDETAAALEAKVEGAAFVACISDFTRSQLLRIAGPGHADKLRVVRCGIDPASFDFAPRPAPSAPWRILTVARLSREKGHAVLFDAVRAMRDRGRDVAVTLVGDGPDRREIEHAITERGLDDHVEILGAQPAEVVRTELGRADVFCLPTFAEGLPVSIMEAMARGIPVVTTAISGIPELVVDGETGAVVPAGRADLIAARIETLMTDDDLRARIVLAARARVCADHDISTTIDGLDDAFTALARARGWSS